MGIYFIWKKYLGKEYQALQQQCICIFKELAPFKVADLFIFPPARNEDAASGRQIQLSGASTGKDGGSGPQIQCCGARPVAFFQKNIQVCL